jgi:pentatricopeptide repeat protein
VHEAESVVIGMLLCDDHDVAGGDNLQQQRQHDTTGELFFWKEYHQSSNFKRVPIHAWTALLKAYVHSGLMSKADSLFSYLMTASGCGESKERKRKKGNNSTNKQNSPNVRTVNTLLRGCMWTAASISNDCDEDDDEKKETKKEENNKNLKTKKKRKKTIKLVGGVLTAERAW